MEWQKRIIDKLNKFTEETNVKIEKLNKEMKIIREREEEYRKNAGYKNINSSSTIIQGAENLKGWSVGTGETG